MNGVVEVGVAEFVGAVLNKAAKGGTMSIVLRLREERQITFEGMEGVGRGNGREAGGSIGAAVEEDDRGNRGLEGGGETEIGGADFHGELSDGIGLGETPGEFGEDGGGGFAEMEIAGIAESEAAGGVAEDGADFAGDEGPAAARAGEGQTGFAGARRSAQENTAAVAGNTGGMNAGDVRVPQRRLDQDVEQMGAKEIVIASGGGHEPDEREAFFDIADGEIVPVGFEREEVALGAPDERVRRGSGFLVGDGDADFELPIGEEHGKTAPLLLGGLDDLGRIGVELEAEAEGVENRFEGQIDGVTEGIEGHELQRIL